MADSSVPPTDKGTQAAGSKGLYNAGRPWAKNWFGSPDHIMAVGAVIAAWNECEMALEFVLRRTLKIDDHLNSRIFHLLGNQGRAELLLLEGKKRLTSEEFFRAQEFISQMNVCRENRNLIAHSYYDPDDVSGSLELSKVSTKDKITRNKFAVSVDRIWEIAEVTYILSQWGFRLALAIWAGPNRYLDVDGRRIDASLLDTLPQPSKLNPLPRSD